MKDTLKYYVFESIWGKRITVCANSSHEAQSMVEAEYSRSAMMKIIEVI